MQNLITNFERFYFFLLSFSFFFFFFERSKYCTREKNSLNDQSPVMDYLISKIIDKNAKTKGKYLSLFGQKTKKRK